jgi:hypothetical protein
MWEEGGCVGRWYDGGMCGCGDMAGSATWDVVVGGV